MDTNYQAIKSLIELLVKKSGFDLSKNYSEKELDKTKEEIKQIETRENLTEQNKEKILSNLRLRQTYWENSAEVIGHALLECYKEGKTYNEARGKIEYLTNLAKKEDLEASNISLMSSIYGKLKVLETEYENILVKINNEKYENLEEKEVDIKLQEYLLVKIENAKEELERIKSELTGLDNIEKREEVISEKLKVNVKQIRKDYDSLMSIKEKSIEKNITFEIWDKLEKCELEIKEKLEKISEIIKKSEKILSNADSKREKLNKKQEKLEAELNKNKNKLSEIEIRIENDDYINHIKKVIDLNEKELVKLNIKELKNKKEVIYIDVNKIKEELIKEWNSDESIKEESDYIEENLEEKYKDIVVEEKTKITIETTTEEPKNVVELDW